MRRELVLLLFAIVSLALPIAVTYAQLGEFAGQPVFNVTLGSNEIKTVTIFNNGNGTINFQLMPIAISSIKNRTSPTITVYPQNGTLGPHQNRQIALNVFVPSSKNIGGLQWMAVVQWVQLANTTNAGGASIQTGVIKLVTINSVTPPFNYELFYAEIAAVVIVAVAIVYSYFRFLRPGAADRKKASEQRRRQKEAQRVETKLQKLDAERARLLAKRGTAATRRQPAARRAVRSRKAAAKGKAARKPSAARAKRAGKRKAR